MGNEPKHGSVRGRLLWSAGLLAGAIGALVAWRASSRGATERQQLLSLKEDSPPVALDAETESRIVAFCGDCHAMPRAASFPRDRWHDEVRMGYQYYAQSGRNDLVPPPMHLTIAYFRSRAPERLRFREREEAQTELHAAFTVEKLDWERSADVRPAVSHLRWTRLDSDGAPRLLVCDMRDGSVAAVDPRDRKAGPKILARLNHPAHAAPCDLDGDDAIDLVVADLGSFYAADHDRGRVVWLRREKAADSFQEIVIASGLGRVADVQPVDLDDDGDFDLIVADFGQHKTGEIVLLRNVAESGETPRFEPEEIDPRPGAIHVPIQDLNRDGRPDFVALISQEYEQVEAFLNRGDGRFHLHTLWTAPDLTFGSSGIELVDLDQDGDTDVLYTNGDAFDNLYINPSHGVGWLENLGRLEFAYHRLTDMPGAYRALAGDVDLDGDLDVVVAAWLPLSFKPPNVAAATLASILCMEQKQPGEFVRHTLETGAPYHAALEMGDFDNDGDLDFAAGSHVFAAGSRATKGPRMPQLSLWWNQTVDGEHAIRRLKSRSPPGVGRERGGGS